MSMYDETSSPQEVVADVINTLRHKLIGLPIFDGEVEHEPEITSALQWIEHEGSFMVSPLSRPRLQAGVYHVISLGGNSFKLEPVSPQGDELVFFPNSQFSQVLDRIRLFWDRKPVYKSYGFRHRMGCLFYGPPGSGKSKLLQMVMREAVARDYVCLICSYMPTFITAVRAFRVIEPYRNILAVIEDLDEIMGHDSSYAMQWLDGVDSCEHIVTLATTNKPEELDRRIISRPGRFDRIYFVGPPSIEQRRQYFASKLKDESDAQIQMFVDQTGGLSFASLADLVISVKCMGNDFTETLATLRKIENEQPSSSDFWADKDKDKD